MKLYNLIKLHTIHVKLNEYDLNCRSRLITIYNSILSQVKRDRFTLPEAAERDVDDGGLIDVETGQ
jgi:hypothetical protein